MIHGYGVEFKLHDCSHMHSLRNANIAGITVIPAWGSGGGRILKRKFEDFSGWGTRAGGIDAANCGWRMRRCGGQQITQNI